MAPATGTPSRPAVKFRMVFSLRKYRNHQTSYSTISAAVPTSHQDQAVQGCQLKSRNTSAAQVTGSLVKVEVGMQNDDYAQITSGLSEGDVVLYTASDDDNSSSMFGGMMMGGMGGGSMGGGAPGGGMGGMR